MCRWMKDCCERALLGLILCCCFASASSAQDLKSVDYLFLGDSNTYAGDYVAMFGAGLRLSSSQTPTCLNLGLPSETVSGLSEPGHAGGSFPRPDLHERLDRILQQVKPKKVFACYGMNCGIYHPYADDRFAAYQNGVRKLAETVKAAGAELIMVTPPLFDSVPLQGRTLPAMAERFDRPYQGYDQVLDLYAAWLVAESAAGNWQVVDLRPNQKAFLASKRKSDKNFTFAPDGVHLSQQGHWLVARELLRKFAPDALDLQAEEFANAAGGKVDLQKLLDLLRKRQRLLTDSYLNAIGHKRPGMAAGLPPAEAEQQAAELERQIVAEAANIREQLACDTAPVMVCTDAGAGAYEAFPDVCRLADGRLFCVFYAGYGHVALPNETLPKGGRIAGCYSSDEGKTWTPAVTLYDGPNDDRDPSVVQLADGRLLCTFFSLKKSDQPPGYEGLGSWLMESSDGGQSWSEPRQLSTTHYCSSPIRILSSGRLILGLYVQDKTVSQGSVIFSDDGGRNWQPEVLIDNAGMKLDAETDIIELRDGSLFAAQRPVMASAKSKDGGASWTASKQMDFAGHCPYFLRTNTGEIVLAYRLPQTSLRFSRDEAETWSENVLVDEVGGAYPSMVNLKDGSVLIVYYEEGDGSNVRARRFQIDATGLKWLSVGR
jgi:sialidase-1